MQSAELSLDSETTNAIVSRTTADAISYGEELSAEAQVAGMLPVKEEEPEIDESPAVIYEVRHESVFIRK